MQFYRVCSLLPRPTLSNSRIVAGRASRKHRYTEAMPAANGKQQDSKPKPVLAPRPSASVVLISPKNEILLAKRVRTASAFASAHVFPGGNIDAQDGFLPKEGFARHQDSLTYRTAALRELFEESGILLARDAKGRQLNLPAATAEAGRKLIHSRKQTFHSWLSEQASGAKLDTDALIPFTHWITPPEVPRRFTTRMYLYLLPSTIHPGDREVPTPTSDGGIEITSVEFRTPTDWLDQIHSRDVFVVPPQYYVLHRLAELFAGSRMADASDDQRRKFALELANTGNPPPSNMYIGTMRMQNATHEGHFILDLSEPGKELEGSGFRGDSDRVMLADKEGPFLRTVGLCWRKDLLKEKARL